MISLWKSDRSTLPLNENVYVIPTDAQGTLQKKGQKEM